MAYLHTIRDVYRFLRFKKKTDAKHCVETQQKELNARGWQTRIRYQASIQHLGALRRPLRGIAHFRYFSSL